MNSENIRMLAVGTLGHHPDNPRKSIGDIEELTDSIRKNGVMQNEPNVVRAAWNIFGKSYEYRQKYNEYKAQRMAGGKS